MLNVRHPQNGWMIVHLCVYRNRREASRGPHWTVGGWDIICIYIHTQNILFKYKKGNF
jgi:hypothetical protein